MWNRCSWPSNLDGTAEGEIKERVVELKLNGDFDADAAIAALAKANYEAELAQ
ncbi:MAG: hypothetical protein R3C56_27445 [Pirellulaceae bacterium]